MTFYVKFEMDNAAFEDDRTGEVLQILANIERQVGRGQTEGKCVDTNGNKVGEWHIADPE